MDVKLIGFAPDAPALTPGTFASCDNVFATRRGFAPFPSLVGVGEAMPLPCTGAAYLRYLDGKTRTFLGTTRKLYRIDKESGLVDVSGGQTFRSISPWRFAQFGNHTIATNGVDAPQLMTAFDEAFHPLPGDPPFATIVETVGYTVFLLAPPNTRDFVSWSGLGQDFAWKPDPGTQAGTQRRAIPEGPITAARKLGDYLVIYKDHATVIAQNVGPPILWSFRAISSEVGAVGQESVVDDGMRHIFVGTEDFYEFDGSGPPRPIESPLRLWFFGENPGTGELDTGHRDKIVARWDRHRDVVVFHYPSRYSGVSGKLDRYIAWSRKPNLWTQGVLEVQAAARVDLVLAAGLTWDEAGVLGPEYDDVVDVAYESPQITGTLKTVEGLVLGDNRFHSFTGAPGASEFTTNDLGDGKQFYFLRQMRPFFQLMPTDPVAVDLYRKEWLGSELRSGLSGTFNERFGTVNLRQAARLHRARFRFTGNYEIGNIDVDAVPAGMR